MDVFRHERHLFDDLLLKEEFAERFLQFFIELLEDRQSPVALCLGGGALDQGIFPVDFRINGADRFHQFAQIFEVLIAVFDFFVDNHAVEPFLGGLGNEFFGQSNVLFGCEAEAIN